jgi:hypothetical protein
MVTAHLPEKLHVVQLMNSSPGAAVGVSVTTVPEAKLAEQVPPVAVQFNIPDGLLLTALEVELLTGTVSV